MKSGIYKETSTPADAFDVTEFKAVHMIADTDFDAVKIPFHLAQAQQELEGLLAIASTNRTIELLLDRFPVSGEIEVERTPIASISSVTYYDSDNAEQTLAAANYDVDVDSAPGRVCRASGVSWPSTYDKPHAVKVTFIAGHGAAFSDVPENVRSAIYAIARDRFNRLPMLDQDTLSQVEALRWRVFR